MAEPIKYMGWSKRYAAAQAKEQARKANAPVEAIRHAHALKRTAKMEFEAGKLPQDEYEMFVMEQDEVIASFERVLGVAPKVEAKPEPKVELPKIEEKRKPKLELPKVEKPVMED